MTEFDEKMKIIPLVRDIIREEHLDPTYNTNFSPNDNEELNKIPRDLYKNVVISMHHYESVEKDFKDWEFKNRRKPYSQYEYPDIPLTPPKDDVVEYYSDSW